jgi:hypothetical protein
VSKRKGRLVIDGKKGLTRETKEETRQRRGTLKFVPPPTKADVDRIDLPTIIEDLKNPSKAIKEGRMKLVHEPTKKRVVGQSPATGQFSPAILGAFGRWRDEKTPIHVLVTETGIKRGKLRRSLIAIAGGKEKFAELRAKGAGGTVVPFGGKRATPRTKETIKLDDSQALHLTRVEAKEQGWKTNGWLRTAIGSLPLLEGPDGTQYVQAKPTEKADLIYSIAVPGIPSEIRMKTLKDSAIAKAATKAKKEVERGEKSIKRTRAAKKARKVRRG